MNRRQFLVAGAAVALAGCSGTDGSRDDAERTLHLTLTDESTPLRSAHVVDLAETRSDRDEQAFQTTLDGDDYTTQHRRPFGANPDPVYTRYEGTYYRLDAIVVDEVTVTHPVVRLSTVGDADSAETPDAVDADRLSEFDQNVVHVGHVAARARGNEGGVPWGLVQRGGYVYRRSEDVARSNLLGEGAPDHVTYRDTVYAIERTDEEFHEAIYRATVDPVAETPERMEAILRAKFVDARVDRSALSTDARSLLREARGDGYGEPHPYSAAYREVLRALHARALLDGNIESDAYTDDPRRGIVQYGGTYYTYRLRFQNVE
ncbi:hypothetical protein [Haloplanus halobius]|uniref:hypothetical protein n=1 Tax=Haloplanus halobius TaxID=2934938 RepID=UPI00200DCEAA|nr:hypothetical protein [Haloplanus sp. XH21]